MSLRVPSAKASVAALSCGLVAAAVIGSLVAQRLPAAPSAPPPMYVLGLTAYLTAAGALYVRVVSRRQADLLDLFEAALVPALVLLPGALLVGAVVVAKVLSQAVRRVPPEKCAFNAAQWAAAAAAGSLVLTALRGPGEVTARDVPAVLLAMAVVAAVNTTAVHSVLVLVGAAPRNGSGRVLAGLRDSAGNAALTLTLGLAFLALWMWAPLVTPVCVVVLAALHLATRSGVSGRVAAARLLGLARAHAALAAAPEPRAGVPAFLHELRGSFASSRMELHLLEERGFAADTEGSDGPIPGGERDGDLVAALLAHRGPVHVDGPDSRTEIGRALERAGRHDCLAAPVMTGEHVTGLLVAYDREGPEGFERGELSVLAAAAAVLGESLQRGRLVDALTLREARWRTLVQDVSDVVLVTDAELLVQYASPAAQHVLGVDAARLTGQGLLRYVHPEDLPATRRRLAEILAGRDRRARLELRVGSAAGWRPVEAVVSDLRDDAAVGGVVLALRDISERRRMETFRSAQTRVLERIARTEPLEQVLADIAEMIQEQVSAATCVVLEGDGSVMTTEGAGDAATADLVARLVSAVAPALGAADNRADAYVVPDVVRDARCSGLSKLALAHGVAAVTAAPLGRDFGALVLTAPVPWRPSADERDALAVAARLAYLAVEHSRTQAALSHRALHDPLTDLPNRTLFLDRLGHALQRSNRDGAAVLVLFLDLDRFKDVNDSLGHRCGDDLLRAVAARLRHVVRPADTVARFGGDEFTVLCEGVRDEAHAVEVAQRLRAALAAPFTISGTEVWATASTGLVLSRDPLDDPEALVERADSAMYRAKRDANAYRLFDDVVRHEAAARIRLQAAMHRAVERGEFRLYYQPQISLSTGRILGVEALVRWEHPEDGLLTPDRFIALAEETGLIVPIGKHVLREACAQADRWARQRGRDAPSFSVSVNLSACQLVDSDLIATVRTAVDATGVDPMSIGLELTESALMQDAAAAGVVLDDLKKLGVQLYVDDFGTGYSSLSYLSSFPVDGLKVDRSFVSRLPEGPGDRGEDERIVRAVVDLAHTLDLRVVAEGIETEHQAYVLRQLNCEVGQGYLLGRPVPPDRIPV